MALSIQRLEYLRDYRRYNSYRLRQYKEVYWEDNKEEINRKRREKYQANKDELNRIKRAKYRQKCIDKWDKIKSEKTSGQS